MRVLIVEPLKPPYERDIDRGLESMQKIVSGYIQVIYPFEDEEIALICNEEGKLRELTFNRALRDGIGTIYDIVVGTFILCRAPVDEGNFVGLTDEQLEFCKKRFEEIDLFLIDLSL